GRLNYGTAPTVVKSSEVRLGNLLSGDHLQPAIVLGAGAVGRETCHLARTPRATLLRIAVVLRSRWQYRPTRPKAAGCRWQPPVAAVGGRATRPSPRVGSRPSRPPGGPWPGRPNR